LASGLRQRPSVAESHYATAVDNDEEEQIGATQAAAVPNRIRLNLSWQRPIIGMNEVRYLYLASAQSINRSCTIYDPRSQIQTETLVSVSPFSSRSSIPVTAVKQ